jgi:hypothetical protein
MRDQSVFAALLSRSRLVNSQGLSSWRYIRDNRIAIMTSVLEITILWVDTAHRGHGIERVRLEVLDIVQLGVVKCSWKETVTAAKRGECNACQKNRDEATIH